MSIEVHDEETQFMCCGRRMVLMPYAGVWAIGCAACEKWADEADRGAWDEPVFIITSCIEIGGN